MDLRRLHAFVKIVDIGSITRASSVLHIAQPALSQQIAALETHFGRPLLLRSKRGVAPTEAGKVFYKHCQLILKQLDQAEQDITSSSTDVSGFVSVGLAPLSLGSLLAVQLMKAIRREHPGIVLHINENVGGVISELIMTGKMDVALIYDPGGIPGVSFDPVQTEELYFVTTHADTENGKHINFETAVSDALILPSPIHTVRQVIDTTLARTGLTAKVIAQTESISVLANAVGERLGSTILPLSAAKALQRRLPEAGRFRIRKPNMKVHMAICVSDQLPLSEPAAIVLHHLTELARSTSEGDEDAT
jgi:LysR family nitrogen assimilation transcriptional regulator